MPGRGIEPCISSGRLFELMRKALVPMRKVCTPVIVLQHFPWVPLGYRISERGGSLGGFMGIGMSVFLLAVGGILAFGVSDRLSGVDLTVVGYVLMGAGAIGLAVALMFANQRSRTTHTSVHERRDFHDE
jgi:hypothetical protein